MSRRPGYSETETGAPPKTDELHGSFSKYATQTGYSELYRIRATQDLGTRLFLCIGAKLKFSIKRVVGQNRPPMDRMLFIHVTKRLV